MNRTKTVVGLSGTLVILAVAIALYLRGGNTSPEMLDETMEMSADMKMRETAQSKDIVIPTNRLQTIGVRVDTVEYRRLDKAIRTVGRVDYDERLLTTISTKVSGWIEKLYIDYTGKFVGNGDALYEIYSPEVVSSEEEYLSAVRGLSRDSSARSESFQQGVTALLQSTRDRLRLWDVPDVHIQELESTGLITKTMVIHSPTRGFVMMKNILEGDYIRPGHKLFMIGDLSNVWVYADIYEYEIPLIKLGQPAELTLSYYPGEMFRGKVAFIYPYLEEKTRTIKIRFEFPNPAWKLKPGMYANVNLFVLVSPKGLAVPQDAVLDTGERQIVFVKKGEGVFEPRDVKLGIKAEGFYEVLDGLSPGEVVVTSANFLIDSESRLASAAMKMKM